MSSLSLFLKGRKEKKENTTYAATESLKDEKGKPLLWTIRPLSTKQTERIREDCTLEVQVTGKPNLYRQKLQSSRYLEELMVASIVEPNLFDAELQDSYGVSLPGELLKEILDDPGEYNKLAMFIQQFNNMDATLQDKVDEAKN